jgi:hypothetical protein
MPTIAKDNERFYLANVRQLLAIDPDMPVREMQRQLTESGLELDRAYLTKLVEKHRRAQIHRIDKLSQKKAIAQIHDVLIETTRRMWPILLDPMVKKGDKIAAAKEIREAHHLAYKLMQEAGYFEPPKLGTIEVNMHADQTVDALMADIRALWGAPLPVPAPLAIVATEPEHGAESTPTIATAA